MTEEYRDGDFEYGVVESLIEEIVDEYGLKAHIYLECDRFDNAMSTTMSAESVENANPEDIEANALMYTVADMLKDKTEDERNAVIALIYESVHDGIHLDDEDDEDEEEENEEFD